MAYTGRLRPRATFFRLQVCKRVENAQLRCVKGQENLSFTNFKGPLIDIFEQTHFMH